MNFRDMADDELIKYLRDYASTRSGEIADLTYAAGLRIAILSTRVKALEEERDDRLPSVTPQLEKIRVANINIDEEKFKEICKNTTLTILDDSNTPAIQPNTGRWIYGEDNLGTGRDGWYCNRCGRFEFWDYSSDMESAKLNLPNFCPNPNCGAKMQEVEE